MVGAVFNRALHGLRAGGCLLPARFFCLKQDGQDAQDEQDGGLGMRCKGLEDLHVYRIQQETRRKGP